MTAAGPMRAASPATGAAPDRAWLVPLLAAALALAPAVAFAQDAAAILGRAADAARTLTYTGTVVVQRGLSVESSRLVHVYEGGEEFEKLVNLDGPPREVIRSQGEVRCFYPDAKQVRVEPRTFRNAFPSLSPQQVATLSSNYRARKGPAGRVAGLDAQSWVFEPKDGLRYGHELWTDAATGMLLKARMISERGEVIEHIAFLDIAIGAKIGREAAQPTWPATPPDWQVSKRRAGSLEERDTGWEAARLPPGFSKFAEGQRAGRRDRGPGPLQLVYSDGMVAVSVFIEPRGGSQRYVGRARQGGISQYSIKLDDYVVTALGEVPPDAVQMIATSVARR